MADLRGAYNDQVAGLVTNLYHDNGDGTYSLVGAVRILAGSAAIGGVTIADGADAAEGATTDAAASGDVAGSVTGHLRGISKRLEAGINATESRPASPVVSGVSVAWRNNVALVANAGRRGARIINRNAIEAYVKEGVSASPDSYTKLVPPGEAYETTFPAYTGQIDVFFARVPDGDLLVTERA